MYGNWAVGEIRASIDRRQPAQEPGTTEVADDDEVQGTVGGIRVGSDPHPATAVRAVRDHRRGEQAGHRDAVDLERRRGRAMRPEALDDRAQVRQGAAAAPRGGTASDDGIEAGARDADEVAPRPVGPFGRTEVEVRVDAPHDAARGDPRVEGEAEVAAGVATAPGEDRAGSRQRRPAGIRHAVDHLVERAVAADGDHERPAVGGRAARELGRLSTPRGFGGLEAQAETGQLVAESAPPPAGPAAAGRWVHDDERAGHRRLEARALRGRTRTAAPAPTRSDAAEGPSPAFARKRSASRAAASAASSPSGTRR